MSTPLAVALKSPHSGVMYNFSQAGVYYSADEKKIFVVTSQTDGIGGVHSVDGFEEYKLHRTPINLKEKLSKQDIEFLKNLVEDIITHRYPNPTQIHSLGRLADSPDTVRTQAILKFCEENVCCCPLMFSDLGCVDYLRNDVVPQYIVCENKRYYHQVKTIWQRKSFPMMFHALRNNGVSWDVLRKMIEEVEKGEEFEELAIEKFEER